MKATSNIDDTFKGTTS